MHNDTLHRGRKHSYCYCLQDFSSEEVLRSHIKDCCKNNGKQIIIMLKKGEFVNFKTND